VVLDTWNTLANISSGKLQKSRWTEKMFCVLPNSHHMFKYWLMLRFRVVGNVMSWWIRVPLLVKVL
jgi:hypothetical protein